MLILDLWGITFHAVVVFGLGKNLLFESILGRCGGFWPFAKIRKPILLKPELTFCCLHSITCKIISVNLIPYFLKHVS